MDDACTGRSASFPILTFDETTLSPSLGYVFDRRCVEPFESVVSILWKFTRMNGLPGHVLVRHLSSAPMDPYDGIGVSTADLDVRLVARMLGVPMKAVRTGLGSPWNRREVDTRLRYCSRCMSLGYHSMAHQFLGAIQCPAHGDWLQEQCRSCGQASAYRLDSRLLDAPFRCAACRRPYGGRSPPINTRPLPRHMRTSITRAFLT